MIDSAHSKDNQFLQYLQNLLPLLVLTFFNLIIVQSLIEKTDPTKDIFVIPIIVIVVATVALTVSMFSFTLREITDMKQPKPNFSTSKTMELIRKRSFQIGFFFIWLTATLTNGLQDIHVWISFAMLSFEILTILLANVGRKHMKIGLWVLWICSGLVIIDIAILFDYYFLGDYDVVQNYATLIVFLTFAVVMYSYRKFAGQVKTNSA